MVQYFPRLRTGVAGPAKRVPSLLGGPGSRGIKMSKLASVSLDRKLEGQIPQHVAFYPPFTPKGREQITHLFSHDIGIYTEMKAAKHLRWNGIEVKTARRHVVHLNDLRYFTEAGHAFAESIVRRLLADCEKPLWSVTSPRGDGNKPIVRGLAKYRINTALRQALRNAGYYMDGRRLSGEDLQKQAQILGRPVAQEARRRGILQLFGTVEVLSRDSKMVHQVSFKELKEHFEKIVQHLEEELGRTSESHLVNSSSNDRNRQRSQLRQKGPLDEGKEKRLDPESEGTSRKKRTRNYRTQEGDNRWR